MYIQDQLIQSNETQWTQNYLTDKEIVLHGYYLIEEPRRNYIQYNFLRVVAIKSNKIQIHQYSGVLNHLQKVLRKPDIGIVMAKFWIEKEEFLNWSKYLVMVYEE